ncbi:MAG: 6-phosphogluconolactonase [Patescibacteria group bacterium]
MPGKIEIIILKNPSAVSETAAKRFLEIAKESISRKGSFLVALAGGKTPQALYLMLSQQPFASELNWKQVHLFWSDERFVPYEDAESNFGMTQKIFISCCQIPKSNVHPVITTDIEIEKSAQQYTNEINKLSGQHVPKFDLILLGIGADGHTASIFPNSSETVVPSNDLITIVKDSPKSPRIRLTFTYKLINQAQNVIFLVTGKDKSRALLQVIEGPIDHARLPAQGVNPLHGNLTWILDQEAASLLTKKTNSTPR